MSNVIRWNPFKEMEDLNQRLSSLFGLQPARVVNGREDMTVSEWTPLVDITETPSGYEVKIELPEVRRDDVKVSVEGRVLTVGGERKFEKDEKNKRYHRIERFYGAFQRSFSLPEDADDSKVEAGFKDGVLKVTVGKLEQAKPKSIEVKVA
jgi:HSP20 family protein